MHFQWSESETPKATCTTAHKLWPSCVFGEQETMWEWQQGLCKVMVLREAEWCLSLAQPGVHSPQRHSGSLCSQDLTLSHPELTTETCHHPSPLGPECARTDRLNAAPVTASSSRFLRLVKSLSSTICLGQSSPEHWRP